MSGERRPSGVIALFDFDGTLTRRDTLPIFYRLVVGRMRYIWAIFRCAPQLVTAGVVGGKRRDLAREAFTKTVLKGRTREDVSRAAVALAGRTLERGLRPDTTARLSWHLSQGHAVVVVSASFRPFVEMVGERLGVSDVIATRWEEGPDNTLTGNLRGHNVRGAEKVRLISRHPILHQASIIYAYGDSPGDRQMLALAHHPVDVRWRIIGRTPQEDPPRGRQIVAHCRTAMARCSWWVLILAAAIIVAVVK